MNKNIILGLLTCAAIGSCPVTGAKTLYDAKLVVQLDLGDMTAENRAQRLADVKAAGADALEIALCEFFPEGEARTRQLEKLKDMIAFFEGAGYPVALWTSSLGYGESKNPDLLRRFPGRRKLKSFGGEECVVCSTDAAYVEALAENVRDFIRAGAKFILWDDDLVQACRPGVSCVCDAHLALYAERMGRPVTAVEVRDSFTGAPNPLRTVFLDVMGETLQAVCRRLRRAADEVDPSVGMGICASYTHYDLDGVRMESLVRSLMGRGQPRPFLRVSGATYWASPCWKPAWRKVAGLDLGGVMEFVRTQTARYRGTDVLLTDENDTYPRRSDKVPAGMCEVYDKVMIAEGGAVRNKYILRYGKDRVDTAYLEAHIANMPRDAALAGLFRGARPFGFRVYQPEHLLRSATLPDRFLGESRLKAFFSHPMAGLFLAQNGVPTQYERNDLPGAAFGPAVQSVPDEAFRRGLVIDLVAARELLRRGIDVGIASEASGAAIPKEDAEVVSWMTKDGRRVPDLWLYGSADGRRFAVLNHELWNLAYGEGDGERVEEFPAGRIWRFFTGRDIPVEVVGAKGVHVLAKERADGSPVVLVCNVRAKPTGPFRVRIMERDEELGLGPWGFRSFWRDTRSGAIMGKTGKVQ